MQHEENKSSDEARKRPAVWALDSAGWVHNHPTRRTEVSVPVRLRHGAVCAGAVIATWRLPALRLPAHGTGATGNGTRLVWGQTFGELKVVGRSRKRTKMGAYWTCLCICGYTCEATAAELMSGRKTHCGCKSVKNYASADITCRRFGRLTAQYSTKKRDTKGFVIWHCHCDSYNEGQQLPILHKQKGVIAAHRHSTAIQPIHRRRA